MQVTSKETKSIVGLFFDFAYVILKGPNKRFNRKKKTAPETIKMQRHYHWQKGHKIRD